MKVKGEYMGREDEMILEVTEKEQNKRLVTEQKEGPFNQWKSIQIIEKGNGNNNMHVRHEIECELPTTVKIANFLSGDKATNKIQHGLQQADQTVKQKLESNSVSNA